MAQLKSVCHLLSISGGVFGSYDGGDNWSRVDLGLLDDLNNLLHRPTIAGLEKISQSTLTTLDG